MPGFHQIGAEKQPSQDQPSFAFWKDLREELGAARTPEEKAAIWQRYECQKANGPIRRQRRGSTLEPVTFRPLDRNQRARLVFLCEKFDARTRERGKHGGCDPAQRGAVPGRCPERLHPLCSPYAASDPLTRTVDFLRQQFSERDRT